MTNSSLKLGLASISIFGGVGLSIFGSKYFQRTSTDFNGKIGGYLLKRGLEITNYDDPIWDEEFERYKKETNNEDGLKSAKELRNKCKELFETKFDESNDDLLSFDEDFCIGKTKLSKWINDKGKKIVDFEKDKSIWTRLVSSNPENQQKQKKSK